MVSAEPCPDVEVVFARGTGEPPGIGSVGGLFVDALRSQVGAKSLGVYAVNYPASNDFASSDFLRRSSTEFATRALISSQWR